MSIFEMIQIKQKSKGFCLFALIDPDEKNDGRIDSILDNIHKNKFDLILLGGSSINSNENDKNKVAYIKSNTDLPIILFPGDSKQITSMISSMLYLNLISGRNPKYLIEEQVKGSLLIDKYNIETIPTAYILLDGGKITSVAKVSKTTPLSMDDKELVLSHALAGQYMGNKLIYCDCGSGAETMIDLSLLSYLKSKLTIPIIIGGGIKSYKNVLDLSNAGASYIVIGNALENNSYLTN